MLLFVSVCTLLNEVLIMQPVAILLFERTTENISWVYGMILIVNFTYSSSGVEGILTLTMCLDPKKDPWKNISANLFKWETPLSTKGT